MLFVIAQIGVSQRIHHMAIWTVLRAPMSYFDTTIKGRIVNRFSNDLQKVDMNTRGTVGMFLTNVLSSLGSLGVVVVTSPYITIGLVPLAVVYYFIMQYYRASVRELQRLASMNASPIYAHFGEVLSGVSTIRANSAEDEMESQNDKNLSLLLRPTYLQQVSAQWLNLRLDMIGAIITGSAAAIAVWEYGSNPEDAAKAGIVGFTLSNSLSITNNLKGVVNNFVTTETALVAVERLEKMCTLEQEAALEGEDDKTYPDKGDLTGADWPKHGRLQVQNVTMSYREGLQPVLRDLSFDVQAGHKVGIVGRTGAGKSSILVALFRIADPLLQGRILLDGVDIGKVGLHTLRKKISIIPQDPVLFSGTLLSNLDPQNVYGKDTIWEAIKQVKLESFVKARDGQLEMTIEPNGENLSVGQRQLFCLARALLRKSKLLVLDEATASVDHATDEFIQQTLRQLDGVTMLTIAHRINTIIDYDRVAVLQKGRLIEYDHPRKLQQDTSTQFSKMAKMYLEDNGGEDVEEQSQEASLRFEVL